MAIKTRFQNPVVGDTLLLKLFARNSNNFADLYNIDHVDIRFESCPVDCASKRDVTSDILVETIPGSYIQRDDVGMYHFGLLANAPQYQIGRYHDIWYVTHNQGDVLSPFKQSFILNPDLWVLSGTPVVYSFDFRFTPNRMRQGSKKWLVIQIIPNVPRATDLMKYYENLAISAELRINIEQNCGPCVPSEQDLRLVVDNDLVTERDKVFSYYKVDTTDWDCGIYNVWMELDYAGNVEISPKMQLQIY